VDKRSCVCDSRLLVKPALIVHGGAWNIPNDSVDRCKTGCLAALNAGWSILSSGGSAIDAIEAVIVVLENDPVFDAGYGSHLNLDGQVECDAIIMNAATLRAGSVAAVQRIRNPIRLARKVLEECPHMMLVGGGAERFAESHGVPLCDPEELIAPAEREAWQSCRQDEHAAANHRGHEQGTVGAVALDANGALFAATSTGGTCCKLPGRVGDSPLIGCGCYADIEAGGVSATGYGEAIMKVVLAKTATDFLRDSRVAGMQNPASSHAAQNRAATSAVIASPAMRAARHVIASSVMRAAQDAIALLARKTGGTAGLILLDRDGVPGFAFNTPRMAYAYVAPDGTFVAAV
jgi:L-asparaginase / beta-aspartyl-peptidase